MNNEMTIQQRLSVCFFALACLVLPWQAAAQSTPAPVVTLAQVLELARQRNPDIQAARSNWQAAEANVLPAKTWEPPAIGLEYMGFPRGSANVGGAEEKRYGLSQDIPFPGKLHHKGKAAEHAARLERELYRSTEFEVMARVKAAYYKLMLSQRAIRIFNENLEVMRRFAKI
ncbi:MAG: TolC family protein, partial [Elusimicrobia bacterium]|nr:TolC family protein [Elusimicrobiota bacterium]